MANKFLLKGIEGKAVRKQRLKKLSRQAQKIIKQTKTLSFDIEIQIFQIRSSLQNKK